MRKVKKKYIVDVQLLYTEGGILHRQSCTPQATWATSKAQAEKNVKHRLGKPHNPVSNYYDEMSEWGLEAKLI